MQNKLFGVLNNLKTMKWLRGQSFRIAGLVVCSEQWAFPFLPHPRPALHTHSERQTGGFQLGLPPDLSFQT